MLAGSAPEYDLLCEGRVLLEGKVEAKFTSWKGATRGASTSERKVDGVEDVGTLEGKGECSELFPSERCKF